MPRPSSVVSISLPRVMSTELDREARAEMRSRSELVREALRQYLLHARWRRLRQDLSLQALAQGTGPGDVERLVDEVRGADRR